MSWCAMSSTEGGRISARTRMSTRHDSAATARRIAVFFIWVILIFSQLCLSSSAKHHNSGPSSWFSARKARFFRTVSVHAAASSPSPSGAYFYDDKRIIHTGPNPLHN